jgi:tetratricopeptide (TPR) repeat protein
VLAIVRLYPHAAELLDRAASGAPNAAEVRVQADLMRKMKRVEDVPADSNDPRDLLRRFLIGLFNSPEKEVLARFVTADAAAIFEGKSLSQESRATTASGKAMKRTAQQQGMTEFIADAAAAALQIQQEGSEEAGYRLLARAPGMAQELAMFVVREKGTNKVAAVHSAPAMLGLQALRFVDAGKPELARQWLDWARDYVRPGSGDDPLTTSPFGALWTRGQEASVEDIRLAAALLLPDTKRSAELALPILVAGRETVGEDQKWRVDQALYAAYWAAEKWNDALATADRLAAKYPSSASAFRGASGALLKLNRTAEAAKRGEARLAAMPGDKDAIRLLGEVAFRSGDFAKGREYYGKLLKGSDVKASDYNQHAWIAMLEFGADLHQAIEEARQAVTMAPQSASVLHTLAALYAETGKSAESRDALLRSMQLADTDEPKSHDWYVLGRIAENYGIAEEAIEAYRRVTKPDEYEVGSSWDLAQIRLKGLTR